MSEDDLKAIYMRWELKNNPMKAKKRAMKQAAATKPYTQRVPKSRRGGEGHGVFTLTAMIPNHGLYNRR